MCKNLELFTMFFKLGLFTFGGGYAMIPQIKENVCEKKKWIDEDEMLEVIAIAESTPGPIAINMATYIGYKQNKFLGSLFATLGVILPSLIIIFIISLFLEQFMQNEYVKYAFIGINAAVAFLIIKAGINMVKKMPKKLFPIIIFLTVFILILVFKLLSISFSSIYFILIGGALGIIMLALGNLKGRTKPKDDNELKEDIK